MSVHEFYLLKALITLEQVNTTVWYKKKKIRILISNTAMVGCCKLSCMQMALVMIEMTCYVNHFFDLQQ